MFGSNYSNHLDILFRSFQDMNQGYSNKNISESKSIFSKLQKFYVKLFGVPEIGFQVRALYFIGAIQFISTKINLKNILDAGCGIGCYSFYLAQKFPNAKIVGYDIDKNKLDCVNYLKKEWNITNTKFEYNDISLKHTGKEKHDLIVSIDVLEHIKDYQKVLQNFSSLLNKGGYLYLHVPQNNQKRFFSQFKKWKHDDHVREGFNRDNLINDLKQVKLQLVQYKNSFGFFGSLAWELNHITLSKSFILAGISYPLLYVLAKFDLLNVNKTGLGYAILLQKN